MTIAEPAQVKYTKRLKAAQCCLCYNQNLLNQLSWFYYKKAHFGNTEAIESLLIVRCTHSFYYIQCVRMMIRESVSFCAV